MDEQKDPVISVENVWFAYATGLPFALKDVSCTIHKGEFIAMVGQNGSGKTTLAKHLNGILRPQKGRVVVRGIVTSKASNSKLAPLVGYCYQNPDHQIFSDTVRAEMEFGPRNMGLKKEEINARVEKSMRLVGLEKFADAYPANMGKGQRQKLAVASVLTMQPEVLVVDEPTTGLDWKGSKAIMDLLVELNQVGHTIVFITHDMRIVTLYARRVIMMGNSQIIADTHGSDIKTIMTDEKTLHLGRLRPLQATRIARKLADLGVNPRTLSSDDLISEILEKTGGCSHAGNL